MYDPIHLSQPVREDTLSRARSLVLAESGIPRRFQGIRARDLQGTSRKAAREFIDTLPDRCGQGDDLLQSGKGLMLVGAPGRGKTHTGTALLIECLYAGVRPVYWTAYADYISNRKSQFALSVHTDPDQWWALEMQVRAVREARVLLLDDVGKEAETDRSRFAASELDLLLRQRYRDSLPTIITTNVTPPEFATVYNESMASFIHEAFTITPLTGKDLRR